MLSRGSGPVIMDEGSANGVIVNGVRITAPTAVNQLSRIEVAEFEGQEQLCAWLKTTAPVFLRGRD